MDNNNCGRPLLKSINTREEVFVTFNNTTAYNIEILWIDYSGLAVRYTSLFPHSQWSINTYVSHPWIFIEKESRDRFMVEGKDVYITRSVRSSQNTLMGMRNQQRVNVFITLPMYTLRDIAMRVIKRHLQHDYHAFTLDIPVTLQYELAMMLPRKGDPETS